MNTKPRENLNGLPQGLFLIRNSNKARLKQIGMDSPQTVNLGLNAIGSSSYSYTIVKKNGNRDTLASSRFLKRLEGGWQEPKGKRAKQKIPKNPGAEIPGERKEIPVIRKNYDNRTRDKIWINKNPSQKFKWPWTSLRTWISIWRKRWKRA